MIRSIPVVVVGLVLIGCTRQAREVRQATPSASRPGPSAATPAAPRTEQEVIVVDASGNVEIHWLEEEEAFFVRNGEEDMFVPLVYHGEPTIRWSLREDGAIVVNDHVAGFSLATRGHDELRQVVDQYRGRLDSVVEGVSRLSQPELDPVLALGGERFALAMHLYDDVVEGPESQALEGLGTRLAGLLLKLGPDAVADERFPRLLALLQPTALDLGCTDVGDQDRLAAIRSSTQLRSLYLENSLVDDEDLTYLRGLTQLRVLNLNLTAVRGPGLANLQGLSLLRELSVGNSELDDEGMPHIGGLTQLRSLDLHDNAIGDEGLANVRGLSELRRLNLARTGIGDEGLDGISGLSQLMWLDLSTTDISDDGLGVIEGLTQLMWLSLAETQLSDAGLVSVSALRGLRRLDLARTSVSLEGVESFRLEHPECEVIGP
jgi:hypothetical protein